MTHDPTSTEAPTLRSLTRFALPALVLLSAVSVAEAATLRVDGKRFTSIQEAVDAASSGDKIVISRGRYHARVVIDGLPGLALGRYVVMAHPKDHGAGQ